MKLLTEELKKQIPSLHAVEKQKDPLVIIKYFTPWSFWTWYAFGYDPKDRLFFGYVVGIEKELGYFSLDELESIRGPLGLKIECDLYWEPMPLSRVKSREVV